MTLIDLGDFKLRFDNKEVRINIDGELIDIGARTVEKEEERILPEINNCGWANPGIFSLKEFNDSVSKKKEKQEE